nr:monodehydroascorbate reductase [Tanacetum cinerariifolium]
MDLEVTDVSTQPHPEQMDEGFTATAYPKVQKNLKLTVEEQVILKEPASSTGTLSSLQHLTKDLNFGDLFFNDKPSKADNEKTTAETEVESMVPGLVTKRRKPTSSLRSVDESVAEGIPKKEPRVDDEEADVHRALVESLKSIYDAPRGLLPPVFIREPESGKYQPLPEVQGKGKEKVTDEQKFKVFKTCLNDTMADVNINAPAGQAPVMAPPVHTDDQILPRIKWVPIGKSNCYLDLDKSQSNPIYKIAVDLLKHTNFFRAFTASSAIPSIYIQQFWDTVQYDKTAGCYRCQLDEQWFVLTKDTLREAFQITPVNNNQPSISPPSSDALINFVNELGYPKLVKNLSNVGTNDMFQSWRELTTIINLCLTGNTSGFRKHKFHPRPDSPLHLPNKEHVLRYLKFSANETKKEVFRMPIPGRLITADIQEASYYHEYLENVAKHRWYLAVAKDAPTKEPQVAAEDTDMQKALEESLKSMYDVPWGSLPPVVIREPESGKYQPLPELPRKGKVKFESEEESEKVMHGADEGGQGEGQAKPDPGAQAEGQVGPDPGAQDEGQAGSNPDEQFEGQARPDPNNAGADEQSMPSLVVHDGLDREHIDLDVDDVSPQTSTEQMDEGFTATAYLKVQENLKLTVEEQVLLEEPASSLGTLSSLQHLSIDISFGDLFFSDKPSEANNDKANTKTKVESMVYVMIQQDMSSIPPMTSLIIDLTSRPESLKVHQQFKVTTTKTTTTKTTTTLPPPSYQRQSTTKAMMMKRIDELKHSMAHLILENKGLEEILDKHGVHLYTLEQLDIPHKVSKAVSKVVTEAVDLAIASRAPGASGSSQVAPPPPPPSSTNKDTWMTTDVRLMSSISLTLAHLQMDEDMAPDEQTQSLDDEDIESAHIPKASALASNYLPPSKDLLLAQTDDIATFMDCMDDSILRHNVSKPLPLGGPPGQVTIQTDFFFNKDLEYIRYGSKGSRPALSISKMKATYYPDVGLEQMVPDQFWIEEQCKYDIAAMYVFSMYGYDYMKKIVLRRTDLNEHVIAKRDFKYLYPSDFEVLYLLNLQGHLNHLPPKDKKILTTAVNQWTRHLVIRQRVKDFQLGIESYQTQLNLTKPRWDATGFEYKHDYTVIDYPRAARAKAVSIIKHSATLGFRRLRYKSIPFLVPRVLALVLAKLSMFLMLLVLELTTTMLTMLIMAATVRLQQLHHQLALFPYQHPHTSKLIRKKARMVMPDKDEGRNDRHLGATKTISHFHSTDNLLTIKLRHSSSHT